MTRNDLKVGAVAICGVLLTTYYLALADNLINGVTVLGRWLHVFAGLATLYGFKSAFDHEKERVPWTTEQKVAESMKRIARGEPPLQGFEHLLTGAPAPATTTITTVTTPATPTPPIKGA